MFSPIMMIAVLTFIFIFFQPIYGSFSIRSFIRSKPTFIKAFIASSIATATFASNFAPISYAINEPSYIQVAVSSSDSPKYVSFSTFLNDLESDKISKVVFVGINPTYCRAYYKSGNLVVEVRDGFPSIDDPKSPSGPAQAIAKVQHTPGVVCVQDISDALSLSSRRKSISEPLPMLSHSSYPKEF